MQGVKRRVRLQTAQILGALRRRDPYEAKVSRAVLGLGTAVSMTVASAPIASDNGRGSRTPRRRLETHGAAHDAGRRSAEHGTGALPRVPALAGRSAGRRP